MSHQSSVDSIIEVMDEDSNISFSAIPKSKYKEMVISQSKVKQTQFEMQQPLRRFYTPDNEHTFEDVFSYTKIINADSSARYSSRACNRKFRSWS
jgi:phage-related protein